jgi:hypothetical protein
MGKNMDIKQWNDQADLLYKTKQAIKYYETMSKLYLEQLKILSGNKSYTGEHYEFKAIARQGTIDYKKVPELFGINLEPYRGEPITSWTLTEKIKLPDGL